MAVTYRRPGVYLTESLLVNAGDVASAATVAAFVGVAGKGPLNEPVLVESWSDYVSVYGDFSSVTDPQVAGQKALSYLPFAVYSFFQNGGRQAYIIRSAPTSALGTASSIAVNDAINAGTSFTINATSTGVWGDNVKYSLTTQDTVNLDGIDQDVFFIQVLLTNADGVDEIVESYSNLSVRGDIVGTRRVDSVINDPSVGSRYITITGLDEDQTQPDDTPSPVALLGGVDPNIPGQSDLTTSAGNITKVDGPITLNIVGYLDDASVEGTTGAAAAWVSGTLASTSFPDRSDIFIVNDSAAPRDPGTSSSAYKSNMESALNANPGDSYVAAYGPWIKIQHPTKAGQIIDIPPGGAVMGMMARIDATIGVFRAPAGVIAGLSNALGVQTKFTDTEQGDLNASNINVIRSVPGAGIAVMGGRTRKSYGVDKYVSARRTLIYINELLRRSTQFAVFENNDALLWSRLRSTADRILRPLWEAGGLKGASSSEAYFITCDNTINTPGVIQSGEVRMEVGVALQYPAEFVVIRITQVEQGSFTSEIQPTA
jgi:hypothetical protein